jgi:hypothetical protein
MIRRENLVSSATHHHHDGICGAPQLSDEAPGNLAWESGIGDEKSVEAAFAAAAHITRANVVSIRVSACRMERVHASSAMTRRRIPVPLANAGHHHDTFAACAHRI